MKKVKGFHALPRPGSKYIKQLKNYIKQPKKSTLPPWKAVHHLQASLYTSTIPLHKQFSLLRGNLNRSLIIRLNSPRFKLLKNFSRLQSLNLRLSRNSMKFLEYLKFHRNLETLKIVSLTDMLEIKSLLNFLSRNQLKELLIAGPDMDDKLLDALLQQDKLEALTFSSLRFTSQQIAKIAQNISRLKHLKHFRFASNRIAEPYDLESVIKALNPFLESLVLRDIHSSPWELSANPSSLFFTLTTSSFLSQLKFLRLINVHDALNQPLFLPKFLIALQQSSQLKCLQLIEPRPGGLSKRITLPLAQLIVTSSTLEELNVYGNFFSNLELAIILQALSCNKSLKRVLLESKQQIEQQKLTSYLLELTEAIVSILQDNYTLEVLDISRPCWLSILEDPIYLPLPNKLHPQSQLKILAINQLVLSTENLTFFKEKKIRIHSAQNFQNGVDQVTISVLIEQITNLLHQYEENKNSLFIKLKGLLFSNSESPAKLKLLKTQLPAITIALAEKDCLRAYTVAKTLKRQLETQFEKANKSMSIVDTIITKMEDCFPHALNLKANWNIKLGSQRALEKFKK